MERARVDTATPRERRVRMGVEKRRILFPISLVDFATITARDWFDGKLGIDLAEEICKYYVPNFRNWKDHDTFETEFGKVLDALKASAE